MKASRRTFFQTVGAGVAGLSFTPAWISSSCTVQNGPKNQGDDQLLFIGGDPDREARKVLPESNIW
jgi:hypothetical protein